MLILKLRAILSVLNIGLIGGWLIAGVLVVVLVGIVGTIVWYLRLDEQTRH